MITGICNACVIAVNELSSIGKPVPLVLENIDSNPFEP